jgi:hypothetical protein
VAKFLVCVLKHPEVSKNKALKVRSFTASPNEIVAEFERQTGGQKWQVSYVPEAEFKNLEQKAYADGSPLAHLFTLRRIWAQGRTLYDKYDNEALGYTDTDSLAEAISKATVSVGEGFRSSTM